MNVARDLSFYSDWYTRRRGFMRNKRVLKREIIQ